MPTKGFFQVANVWIRVVEWQLTLVWTYFSKSVSSVFHRKAAFSRALRPSMFAMNIPGSPSTAEKSTRSPFLKARAMLKVNKLELPPASPASVSHCCQPLSLVTACLEDRGDPLRFDLPLVKGL